MQVSGTPRWAPTTVWNCHSDRAARKGFELVSLVRSHSTADFKWVTRIAVKSSGDRILAINFFFF